MAWLKRGKPRDTNALHAALRHGTWEDFQGAYQPEHVNYDGYSGDTLLTLALAHNDSALRVKIATRLLDDGADVTKEHPLHVLVGRNEHDFDAEAGLLQRMLDLGADINEVLPGFGTPLETAAAKFKFSDKSLTPFYDVLLARPDIDLVQPGLDGRPVLINLRKWYAKRGELVERVEALLIERGVPLPDPTK
ncbi:hypothetical protein [Nocardioides campestrisoli]|uniref:hypothetical protein n=1 Tax=Nocardioides campestrisoli TaxID=2736757 RepID=UPI00163D7715|nr:hypothetical protein [Nocardioides campestrisoli]